MFQFPGLPFSFENVPCGTGIPIRQSSDLRLLAPPRSISQLGTVFIGARAEPSIKWPAYCNNPSLSNPLLTFINPKKGFQSFPCEYTFTGCIMSKSTIATLRIYRFLNAYFLGYFSWSPELLHFFKTLTEKEKIFPSLESVQVFVWLSWGHQN